MIKKGENIERFEIECSCGCSELVFDQWTDDGLSFISLVIPAWYASGYTGFKKALKIMWSIVRGKEYSFYEIIIEDNDTLRRFKEFVANMKEIELDK